MAIAQSVAGFSLGQADILRRAMGKKKKSELDKQYEGFEGGMKANGYSDAAIKTLWDILVPFSDYAFNKAHSAAYGVISYWTAYLKAHYPGRVHGGAPDQRRRREGQARGLPERVPAHGHQGAAARCGRVDPLLRRRRRRHPLRPRRGAQRRRERRRRHRRRRGRRRRFTSFHDYLAQGACAGANKRTIESLIKAGAFDSLGATRRALLEIHEDAAEAAVDTQAQRGERRDRLRLRQPVRRHPGDRAREGARSARVDEEGQARLRARDARPVRVRPPARRARGAARQARVDQHPRSPGLRRRLRTATR